MEACDRGAHPGHGTACVGRVIRAACVVGRLTHGAQRSLLFLVGCGFWNRSGWEGGEIDEELDLNKGPGIRH